MNPELLGFYLSSDGKACRNNKTNNVQIMSLYFKVPEQMEGFENDLRVELQGRDGESLPN